MTLSFEILAYLISLTVTFLVTVPFALRQGTREAQLIIAAFAIHALASVVHVLVTQRIYGGGDLSLYVVMGRRLAELMATDWQLWTPRVVDLTLGGNPVFPFRVIGAPGSTGSASGLAAFFLYLTGGSIYAACMLMSFFAFVGQVLIYSGIKRHAHESFHLRLGIVCLFFPSVVYWSSSLLKESYAVLGVGLLFWGVSALLDRDGFRGALSMAAGALLVGIIKAYVLMPFLIATAAWCYFHFANTNWMKRRRFIEPLLFILAAAVGFLGIQALGSFFPRFAFANLVQETASLQSAYTSIEAGSSYALGSAGAGSYGSQLANSPIALFSALFRPLVFEAHNIPAFVNSLETTLALIALFVALRRRGIQPTLRLIASTPVLVFCLLFVLIFALGVGLATPNLGTLSRYRVPMMPFYGVLWVALLYKRPQNRAPTPT